MVVNTVIDDVVQVSGAGFCIKEMEWSIQDGSVVLWDNADRQLGRHFGMGLGQWTPSNRMVMDQASKSATEVAKQLTGSRDVATTGKHDMQQVATPFSWAGNTVLNCIALVIVVQCGETI